MQYNSPDTKEDLVTTDKTYNHIEPECDSKSSEEGGYGSSDDLDNDCEKLEASQNIRSTSSPSTDAGYISSEEETVDPPNIRVQKPENLSEIYLPDKDNQNFREFFLSLMEGLHKPLPPEITVPINDRPEWLDLVKFRAGQKFALDHYIGVSFSMLLSLFILFSFDKGLEPLIFTDKSSTPFTAYKRYLSTALRVKSWFENDLWSEGNQGFQNIRAVRAMHLNVSKRMNSSTKEELKDKITLEGSNKHPLLLCPLRSKLNAYNSDSCPVSSMCTRLHNTYYLSEKRVFFNQTEMSVTQFAFFGLIVLYPEEFGAGGASREDLENFVHCWRGIGYLLGVQDKYNFCRGSLEEVKQRCHYLVNDAIKPSFLNLSKDWEHMSRCVVEGLKNYIPFVNFESLFAYLCSVIKLDVPEFYSNLTWRQYFQYKNSKFFYRYVLRIPGVMSFCNKMIYRIYDAQKAISAEKMELLKDKKYRYENEDVLVTRL